MCALCECAFVWVCECTRACVCLSVRVCAWLCVHTLPVHAVVQIWVLSHWRQTGSWGSRGCKAKHECHESWISVSLIWCVISPVCPSPVWSSPSLSSSEICADMQPLAMLELTSRLIHSAYKTTQQPFQHRWTRSEVWCSHDVHRWVHRLLQLWQSSNICSCSGNTSQAAKRLHWHLSTADTRIHQCYTTQHNTRVSEALCCRHIRDDTRDVSPEQTPTWADTPRWTQADSNLLPQPGHHNSRSHTQLPETTQQTHSFTEDNNICLKHHNNQTYFQELSCEFERQKSSGITWPPL